MIDRFQGEWRFLSNFWQSVVSYDGKQYPTVEHAYQAAKTTDVIARAEIRALTSPAMAKKYGGRMNIRPDWDDMRLAVMEELLRAKFRNGVLMAKLVATRPHQLVEGNPWGDTFWGVSEGQGENHLGRLLMLIRDEGAQVTQVVNKRDHTPTDRDVYIGRGSRWGNEWSHKDGTKAAHKVETVEEAIACYRKWLWAEIKAERITLHDLSSLDGKILVCFCKPGPCHGDVLNAAAGWAIAQLYPKP